MNNKLKNWFLNSGSSYDSDAQAFFASAGITDATQKSAVNALVIALKAANIWTPMKAIYPLVGGAATTHKWNLKDPRDLDAAYRLNFQGGWVHASTGATPNGTTGYADTFFNQLTEWGVGQNKGAMGIYSRTTGVSAGYDIGGSDVGETGASIIIARFTGDKFFAEFGTSLYTGFGTNADGSGLFAGTRKSGFNLNDGYKNGSLLSSDTEAEVLANITLYIGALNKNGTAARFSSREFAFAFFCSTSLTASENASLYTAVQAFQTTLGRQV